MKILDILEIVNLLLQEANITIENISDELYEYGLDSIVFIHVIIMLEEKFEIEIPDSYLLMSNMDTIEKIADVVDKISQAN